MSSSGVLEAIDRIINRGGDSEDVLRGVVTTIVDHAGTLCAAVLFNDEGELILGPRAGVAEPGARLTDRVAHVISPYYRRQEELA